jgi:glycosyltransferase involved in cell wall biosynthesis
MKLAIDASNLRGGGSMTHLVNVLRAAKPDAHGVESVRVWGSRAQVAALPERAWLEATAEPALEGGLAQRLVWQRFVLPKVAERDCDVLWVPGGNAGPSRLALVTMSRNMLPFEWTELRRYGLSPTALRLLLLRFGQARTFRRADGMIFLTQYAKQAVEASVRLKGRVAVVPHGVDAGFAGEARPARPLEACSEADPLRVLYVSIVDLYKHQWHVAEAVAELHRAGLPIALDLVGPSHPAALRRLEDALRRLDPESRFIRYRGPVAHRDLAAVYRRGEVFVFASSCENMPNILLEAMASELPIACARRGPMPEVLGDAGVYFDPESPREIAGAVAELARNPALRTDLARRAGALARAYSWERCADETFAFIAEVGAAAAAERRP